MILRGHISAERGGRGSNDLGVREDSEAGELKLALGRWM